MRLDEVPIALRRLEFLCAGAPARRFVGCDDYGHILKLRGVGMRVACRRQFDGGTGGEWCHCMR